MRWLAWALGFVLSAGCAELGVVSDGTSISVGRSNRGFLLQGTPLPDDGEGFTTRAVWSARGSRYGTDELVDLLTVVARRMQANEPGARLVVADLSGMGGGERRVFHRSHQSGRDVDLLYFVRDASGQPVEADAMRKFSPWGRARDGSGLTVDVPRTWQLVKELITAPEAAVQFVFMYEPIAQRLLDHASTTGEPPHVIARARRVLKQPGDSARHDDHLHVRVYCAAADRAYGCLDTGPMDMLAEREAEPSPANDLLAALESPVRTTLPTSSAATLTAPATLAGPPPPGRPQELEAAPAGRSAPLKTLLGRLVRNRPDLRSWR